MNGWDLAWQVARVLLVPVLSAVALYGIALLRAKLNATKIGAAAQVDDYAWGLAETAVLWAESVFGAAKSTADAKAAYSVAYDYLRKELNRVDLSDAVGEADRKVLIEAALVALGLRSQSKVSGMTPPVEEGK